MSRALPTIIDFGSEDDAGEWLVALPFVRFPVTDFDSIQNVGDGNPHGHRFTAPVSLSLHSTASNQGEIRNHGG